MVQAEIARVRKFKLTVVESEEVATMVRMTNSSSLKKTYIEHFLEHPLEKAERAAKRPKRQLSIPSKSKLTKRDESTPMPDGLYD